MSKVFRAEEMSRCIGCFTCMRMCAAVNHKNFAITKSSIHIKTAGGLSGRFVAVVCLACKDEPACAQACPTNALHQRKGGGVLLDAETCVGCKRCVSACIAGAVGFDEDEHLPIICKHCGVCAQYCPHDCLIMEEVEE